MKVLIVGGGGREHALAWKLAQSPQVDAIFCAPGNAGTAALGTNVDVPPDNPDALFAFARDRKIDLTVVGPEGPLVAGVADRFREGGLRLFGPTRRDAQLEGSKVFAKDLMRRNNIPTARHQVFNRPEHARRYLAELGEYPVVVKADGLAAGKGVAICADRAEAEQAVRAAMEARTFGGAGDRIVIEDCLAGEEASILAICDGRTLLVLPPAQDHKRVFDGDRGPNTGGMGAYAPAPAATPEVMETVERMVLVPAIHAVAKEGDPFVGVLYAGIMLTKSGPKVLEFNVRFGDPEAQPLLMLVRLDQAGIEIEEGFSVCVVLASGGYPGAFAKGREIHGLAEAGAVEGVQVFHAGTSAMGGRVFTSGGRVLGVAARGPTLAEAQRRAYEAVSRIRFEGMQYRKDIAAKGIARLRDRPPAKTGADAGPATA
jgi:phosphoribosylamine--glycine ligase